MHTLALVLLTLTLWTLPAQAQQWSGILDPSRAIDWNNAGVTGGIPTRTTICQTLNPGATAGQINTAIQNCPAGQVVKLNAGTFNLSSGIHFQGKNDVTLRGEGPDKTKLVFTGNTGCIWTGYICIAGTSQVYGGNVNGRSWETPWTGGFTKGSTQLTVGSTANMAAGRAVMLDQLDDTTDTGGIVNSSITPTFANEGGPEGRHDTEDGGIFRSQHHMVKIVSVDDSTHITITPGLHMANWRSARSPEVWGWGTSNSDTVFRSGVEDLTVDGFAEASFYYNITFTNAYDCWVKNVRSLQSGRGHFGLSQAAHITIQDSYYYGSRNHATTSYGIDNFSTSDNLYLNNISDYNTTPHQGPCQGCVTAYNYHINMFYSTNPTFNFHSLFATHDSGGGMALYEGNQTNGIIGDFPHGNSPLNTAFRNHFNGNDDIGTKSQNQWPVVVRSWARAWNFVGNVLGTPGLQTVYQVTPSGGSGIPIYSLGSGTAGVADDNVVITTLLRWGNYDTVNAASRFLSAEIPTAGVAFVNGNPVPSNNTLPASFFLPSQPGWWTTPWGTPAWPPIGPDVTGGDIAGYAGHAYTIPAKRCYTHLSNDPAYSVTPPVKIFNAATCYSKTSVVNPPPAPPKNLTVH